MDVKKETTKKTENKDARISRLEEDLKWLAQKHTEDKKRIGELERQLTEGLQAVDRTYSLLLQMTAMQYGKKADDSAGGWTLDVDYIQADKLKNWVFAAKTAYGEDGKPTKAMIRVTRKEGTADEL